VTDYLKAVGAFPRVPADGNAIATELAEIYAALPARQSVLRANVTHYPRSDLPGKCFGIVTAFHDLPDFTIAEDLESFGKYLNALRRGREMPGSIFEVRQVWQMAGDEPRLIEATVEFSDRFASLARRRFAPGFFADKDVQKISADQMRGGHFEHAGGGVRRGIMWCDRSMGVGEPRPWSAAYRVSPKREFSGALDPELVTALKRFVSRF